MARINQEELEKKTRKHVEVLVNLMVERNKKYSTIDYTKKEATSNFWRNADLNRILRLTELLDKPYGTSIEYVVQKVDRLINGILLVHKELKGKVYYPPLIFKNIGSGTRKTIADSIDDAIVYLIITKRILEEMGL